MDSTLQILRDRVLGDRRRMLFASFAADLLAISPWMAPLQRGESRVGSLLVSAVLIGVAVALLRGALRPVDAHPVLRAIAEGGGDIVWIYVRRIRRRRKHTASWLVLGLAGGELAQIELPRERDYELMRAVSELAPHATVGYDGVFERAFRADAASLRRVS